MTYADAWLKWFDVIESGAHPLSARMIELADLAAADRVLDIGTGIGEPALAAADQPGFNGRVTAIDRDPGMIKIARARSRARKITDIEFIESDIEDLPLDHHSFDVILARWSLMFVDLPLVLNKLKLALSPGGKLVIATWASPEQVPALSLAKRTVHQYFNWDAPAYGAGTAFALSNPSAVEKAFSDAGLGDICTELVPVTYRYESAAQYIQCRIDMTGPLWQPMADESKQTKQAVFDAIEAALQVHRTSGGEYRLLNQAWCFAGRAAQ